MISSCVAVAWSLLWRLSLWWVVSSALAAVAALLYLLYVLLTHKVRRTRKEARSSDQTERSPRRDSDSALCVLLWHVA